MSDDNDDTPDDRPGHWGDARRAREGQRRRHLSAPRGVVTAHIDHERTPVWDERDGMAPLTRAEGQQLIAWIKARPAEPTDRDRSIEERLTSVEERTSTTERDVEPLRALRKWLWTSSIGVVVAVALFFLARGDAEGEQRQRVRTLERDVEELRRDVRDLERSAGRHSSVSPAIPPDAVSSASEGHQ